jgi:hypothetical protein
MPTYHSIDGFLIPDRIAQAFEGRTSLTLAEAADALEMDERHLREAADKGRIHYVLPTVGRTRKMRRFLLIDLIDFLKAERRQECPSISAPTRRPTGANSGSKVIGFASLRAKLNNDRPSSPKRG